MASPASSPPPDAWTPPQEFDEYRLIRLIGRGRTGRVYLAHDTLLERPVAVKFIPALGHNALSRFLVEARAAALGPDLRLPYALPDDAVRAPLPMPVAR